MEEKDLFEEMKELDDMSELREHIEDRYKPIYDAKIAYRLQKISERRLSSKAIMKGSRQYE